MNRVFEFLSRYNRREQTILLTGALAIILYILWIAIVSPLQQKRDTQLASNAATSAALGRVEILALQVKHAQNSAQTQGGTGGGNISQVIDSSLRANGLAMSGFQPGTGGEVRVRLDNVNYEPLMQWLYDLEYRHDIAIRDLSLAAGNQPGQVTANVRLRNN